MQATINIPENSEIYKKLRTASEQSGYSMERLAEVLFDLGGRRELDKSLEFLRKHHPRFRAAQ